MPETSIVVKAEDRYSPAVKKMASTTKAFSKDTEEMEKKLTTLSKKRFDLRMDLEKAKKELKDAEKQFQATGDAADRMTAQGKQANFDALQKQLRDLNKEAKQVEKGLDSVGGTARKLDNQGFGSAIMKSGMGKMWGDAMGQMGNTLLSSAIGEPTARLASGILSGAITGAGMGMAAGSILGLPGAAVGAAVGGVSGLVSGAAQIFQARDDAFQSYVQTAVEDQYSQRESDISSGSSIAAQREKDQISFSTLFGDEKTAKGYLSDLVGMANTTPFLYDDLTAMSKTLATYGYGANGILPVLQTIGDTGAALGMGTSDMSMVATALGRMKSSNKTTLEYLNILNDRGIGAVGMLADYYQVDQGEIYDRISKGKIAGTEAVEIILQALTEKFSGSMLEQSKTFSGLTSTLEGMSQEQQNAYGEGYNGARKKGLSDQISFLSGESGEQMEEANRAIGAWYASLENEKERLIREAQKEVLESDAYKEAMAAGTDEGYAKAGRLLMEAKIKAQNEYNASEGAQLLKESEMDLIRDVRADTAVKDEYWDAGYELGQEFSKGIMDGLYWNKVQSYITDPHAVFEYEPGSTYLTGGSAPSVTGPGRVPGSSYLTGGYAYGLERVPYDNFPALLHEGERVLMASQARGLDRGGGGVHVEIGSVTFGASVSDPEEAAEVFARKLTRELMLARPDQ